jgi:hypothetical protein
MTVDCMACLVALARGVPEGGTYIDKRGITHATLRSQHLDFLTCTVYPDPNHPGQIITHRSRWRTTLE